MRAVKKRVKYVVHAVRLCLAVTSIVCGFLRDYKCMMEAAVGLALSFIPSILSLTAKITLPWVIELMYALFLFSANLLGSCLGFYELIPTWDVMLHMTSGVMIAMLSLTFLNGAVRDRTIRDWKPFMLAMFMMTFVMACGTLWEFFEFFMDSVFGYGMQKQTILPGGILDIGLIDTMGDEMCSFFAGLIYATLTFTRAKKGKYEKLESLIIKKQGG